MIKKLEKYSKEKWLLYSSNDEECFYNKEAFNKILMEYPKNLTYAKLLLMTQNEYNLSNEKSRGVI